MVLVTGATSGLGLATAGRLAASGSTVIIHGPSQETVTAARIALALMNPSSDFHEAVADFSSQAEVRALAADIQDRFSRLDVLVNNAATVFDEQALSRDGIERTFAVNHLAPYLLTRQLLPAIERSDQGRIVIVASEAHRNAVWDIDGFDGPDSYDRFDTYARSKLANLLFNAELARRLEDSSVTTNAVHPGTVRTRLFRPRNAVERVVMPILDLRGAAPEVAADGIAWLADSHDMSGRTGGYYHKQKPVEPSPAASDEQNAFELWKLSAELTDLPWGLTQ